MVRSNLKMSLNFIFNKKNRDFLIHCHKLFKKDKNYSFIRGLNTMFHMMKGEKLVKFNDMYILSSFLPPFPSKAMESHIFAARDKENLYTSQMYSQRTAPISFFLAITNKCFFNCIHCSAKNRTVEKELNTEEWKKIIKEIQDMNTPVIGFTGGEPLLRDDIEELISFVDERSISILFTSGMNLTIEKARNLKAKGLFATGISLDSYIEEEHDKKRGVKGSFQAALRALRNSRDAGLYTMVQTVVLKNDISEDYLIKLSKLAYDNGAHEIRVLEPIRSGKLMEDSMNEIFYSNEDRKKLINIQHKINNMNNMPKITTFAYTESKEKYGCGAGTQHSYINPSGELFPCDFVPLSFGNASEISLSKLWLSMNSHLGNPKLECFAQKIHRQLLDKNKELPLQKEESEKFCDDHKNIIFPEFYCVMQGKK